MKISINDANKYDFKLIHLRGIEIKDKKSYIRNFGRAMAAPGDWTDPTYFGENWDSLDEYIRDLEWIPANGYIILYEDIQEFAEREHAQFEKALEILKRTVSFWETFKLPMFIFLAGKGKLMHELEFPKLSLTIQNEARRT